jgi:hypothetical protein
MLTPHLRGLVFVSGLLLTSSAPAQPSAQGVDPLDTSVAPQPVAGTFVARPAAAFIDSVGVCGHFGRFRTNFVQRFDELEPLILALGVRHFRTGPVLEKTAAANLQRLAAHGITFNMAVHPDRWAVPEGADAAGLDPRLLAQNTSNPDFIPALLEHVKASFGASIRSLEGLNEPDHNLPSARVWMQTLRDTMRRDPAFDRVRILGSALSHPVKNTAEAGDWSELVDLANLHAYPGGRAPEVPIPRYLEVLQAQYRDRPVYITETGYHNALHNPPERHRPASREVEAVYLPRLFLEHFRLGVARSYDFKLLDDRTEEEAVKKYGIPLVQEAHFGLIDYHLQPKPAYHALKNLLALLRDSPASIAAPRALRYELSGPADLRHVLLEKSSGTLFLAVWRAATIWEPVARKEIPCPAAATTVTLGRPFPVLRIHRPSLSDQVIDTLRHADTVTLQLGADVVLLEIPPS